MEDLKKEQNFNTNEKPLDFDRDGSMTFIECICSVFLKYCKFGLETLLNKQTPQKPIVLTNVYPDGQYKCECGCALRASDKWHDKYCPNCGQAIDWSDFK